MPGLHIQQKVSLVPLMLFFTIVAGIVLHILFPLAITTHTLRATTIGFVLLFIGPLLVFWSDHHRTTEPCEDGTLCHTIGEGPYRFSRHPKYIGYMALMIGLGFIMNSVIILIITTLFIAMVTLFVIPGQEKLLEKQFPGMYGEYKKRVRMWI